MLKFNWIGRKILFNHECYFKYNCIFEFAQIQTGNLLNFFKPVYQCISVHKQFTRGFGNIQIILKKPLNGEQCFMVKGFYGATLKYFFQEHFTKSSWQLINQTGNTKIVVTDNRFSVSNTLPTSSATCASLKERAKSLIPVTMVPIPTTQWV